MVSALHFDPCCHKSKNAPNVIALVDALLLSNAKYGTINSVAQQKYAVELSPTTQGKY